MPGFAEQLAEEAQVWVREGIITPEQRSTMMARHPQAASDEGRTMRIVSWIGGSLVVVGIIIWVASNWQVIPDGVRTLILVAVAVGCFAGGWQLLAHKYVALGHVALAIGGAAIGGTIFQIANWGNLAPDNPMLLALWILCLVPLAYAFRSAPLLAEAIIVLPFWLAFSQPPRASAESLIGLYSLAALALAGLGWVHAAGAKWPGFRLTYQAAGTAGVLLLGFVETFVSEYS